MEVGRAGGGLREGSHEPPELEGREQWDRGVETALSDAQEAE